ncbi:MAG: head GIN domain-containing protein [Candidatus Dojkabacteria bacterium]
MSKKTKYIILTVVLALMALCTVCGIASISIFRSTLVGSGNVINQKREIGEFQAINLATTGEIILTQGSEPKLEIQGEDNILENIVTEVVDGTLTIKRRNTIFFNLIPTKPIVYNLTVTTINELTVSGSGLITAPRLQSQSLDVNVSGSGSVTLDLFASNLDIVINGSGSTEVAGNVEQFGVTVNGPGAVSSYNLRARDCNATINGSGTIKVNCRTSLSANVNGSGEILYEGNPEVTENVTGSGRIWSSQ